MRPTPSALLPRRRARRPAQASRAGLVVLLALAASLAAGCQRAPEPLRESRDALGTIVTLTAFGENTPVARRAAKDAYEEMAAVERELDAQDASSAVAAFNRTPYEPQPLPGDAGEVFDAVERLGVGEWFSPSLLGVLRLYRFEAGGRVPDRTPLLAEVALARTFGPRTGHLWAFARPRRAERLDPPGLDLGGAAKGLALDRAAAAMRADGVPAALLTATSTTLVYGSKPGDEPWRIGIEDPREGDTTVATIEAPGALAISTSGDYQRFFERDGVRYHHIVDPRTGEPARGLWSLTVLGDMSALDSDILSTALFVAGRKRAETYVREHGLGLVTVDDKGRVGVIQPRDGSARISAEDD